jgi:mRNA-degrading endonuclease RelE of RelBE toxin-antitoxin system
MKFRFSKTPRFDRSLRKLKKRYPHIGKDLVSAFAEIEKIPTSGVIIPKDYSIRKLRVKSNDMKRGKSGGFRLLYKLLSQNDDIIAVLLFIYAKTDQSDVPVLFLGTLEDEVPEEE